ncbi:LysR family transcriptional regulator [Psychrobium sp. 1_MG-2023]|uniref:LysR family transcriptional regulator n=1 Tax=Psychrobium sp. 1_MG-2023 TaxID=3062624 RepID=UPI000C332ED5|nr:LysR family transcriptional regulator [Psychrobium sp. 1_MG-2023]MDP2560830.1 LysR family transcriptional regulator [Psychrobium sp. 1_MG-2023]PKF56704.1 LysR family transcriptional regulator [Alteromonadales bacterium alter-6D02]
MIERIHLAIIQQVDQLGTLTQAANALFLTQSALSHAIKKLEGQLNVKIWSKDGRRLRLTAEGKSILALANRVLPQLEHTEQLMAQFAKGERGNLRIGMECHPCYQWLLKVVSPYLNQWPNVDVDVKQKFQFGGLGALFNHEIDALVTPDPLFKRGLTYASVFDYELVLVVSEDHPLASVEDVTPQQLSHETLITYPVELERLDIFSQFMLPANCHPKKHKTIETTDIIVQMVANNRGISALPAWLVEQYQQQFDIKSLRLGKQGVHKHIYIGFRDSDADTEYISSFIDIAKSVTQRPLSHTKEWHKTHPLG